MEPGLTSLPLDKLAALGERLKLQDELTSKARLLADIPGRLADRGTVRRFVRELEESEAEALFVAAACEKLSPALGASVLFRFGKTLVPDALTTRGLLLPDEATGLYRPPAEILPWIDEEAAGQLGSAAAPPASASTLEAHSAFRDAVAVWCYIIKNPITLTQSGSTPKRALSKVVPLLEVPEEDPSLVRISEELRFNRLELLVDDLETRGALERYRNELRATNWLSEDDAEKLFDVGLLGEGIEADDTGGGLYTTYLLTLSENGGWYPAGSFAAAAAAVSSTFDGAAARRALFATFVAGYAAVGVGADGSLLISRSKDLDRLEAGSTHPRKPEFLLGGNFELTFPYDAPITTRLRVEAFADQAGGGRLLSYRISKASFYRALDAGVTIEEVLAFLNEHVSRPVPQNVEFSLRDWAGQYGVVAFHDGLVVAAETKEIADEIAKLPTVEPFVRGRRELHAVEISTRDYDAVRDALTAAGFLPRSLASDAGVSVSSRALFDAKTTVAPADEENVELASCPEAVVRFAAENNRTVKLWLAGEEGPLEVVPLKITRHRGESFVHVSGNRDQPRIPLTIIERAAFK